jgi:hypothetical protein
MKFFSNSFTKNQPDIGYYRYNTWETIMCMQFEAIVQSKISPLRKKSVNMQEIDQNVPQIYDFWKCSSGPRIQRSHFVQGLTQTKLSLTF